MNEKRAEFEALIKTAETLEKISDPEYNGAGPTFWNHMDIVSRLALNKNCLGKDFSERDKRELYMAPDSPVLREALSAAFDEFKPQIWKRSAEILRTRAARMKESLMKEASDILALAASLDSTGT